MNDSEIIDLFWSRSERGISELKTKYGRMAYSVSMNILHDRLDSEENMNDSYLAMWNAIPNARPNLLPAFFIAITRNNALKLYRKNNAEKRCAVFEELTDLISDTPCGDNSADGASEIISEFLGEQPKKNRVLFMRRYYMGDSITAAAKFVGMTDTNAAVTLSRMRKKLKEKLISEGINI